MSKQINFPQHLTVQVLSASHKDQNILYLPKRFQLWYQEHQHTLYVHGVIWKMTCYKHPEKIWYFQWTGFTSPSTSSNDFFEDQITISSYLLEHNYTIRKNISNQNEEIPYTPVNKVNSSLLSSGDRVVIEAVASSQVAIVKEVLLQPLSSFDFDILSTMGEYVEQNLLRSLNPVVFVDQLISIPVRNNQSLQAKLRVKELALLHNSSSTNTKNVIARINAQTSLIIEPYHEEGKKLTNSQNVQMKTEDVFADIAKPLYTTDDLQHVNISKASAGVKLRVLPQHLSMLNTSFSTNGPAAHQQSLPSDANHHMQKLSLAEALAGDEILDALFTDVSSPTITTVAPSSSSLIKQRTTYSKACRAFVHPTVIASLLERSLHLKYGTIKSEDTQAYLQNTDGNWMIRITNTTTSAAQVQDHYTLCLEVKDTVRPQHIVLPTHVRKAMVLWDYDEVEFQIFSASHHLQSNTPSGNNTSKKIVMPKRILFRPVVYNTASSSDEIYNWRTNTYEVLYDPHHNNGNSSDATSKRRSKWTDKLPSLTSEMVTAAFLRFVEQHSTEDDVFCLAQDNLIHLTFSSDQIQNGSNEEDIEVDFLVNLKYSEAASKDTQLFRYLPLTLFTEAQSQILSYVLQVIEVASEEAIRVMWNAQDLHVMSRVLDQYSYGYSDTTAVSSFPSSGHSMQHNLICNHQLFEQITTQLAVQLNPFTAKQRWDHLPSTISSWYSPSFLITGKHGTGKTYMLQTVMKHFHHHPMYCTSTIYLNGKELRNMPLQSSIKRLQDVFSVVGKKMSQGSVLLLIDDIDVLCPSHQGKSSSHIVDERSILLATYLSRSLMGLRQRQSQAERHLRVPFSIHGNSVPNSNSLAGDESWIYSKLLSKQIVCVASANSLEAMDDILIQSQDNGGGGLFARCLSLPSRIDGEEDRITLLQSLLSLHHIPLYEELGDKMKKELTNQLEKFCMKDYEQVIQRIYLQVRQRHQAEQRQATPSHSNHILSFASLQSKHIDILKAMQAYTCIQDQSQDSLSTTSSFRVPPPNSSDGKSGMTWKTHVAGYQQVQSAIYEVLYYPILFQRLYAQSPVRLPRAIMLYGPPGCGKTYLAKTVGYELFTTSQSSHFYYIKGPQLLNKYIGASEKMVRDLFQQALQHVQDEGSTSGNRNVLIFFDEFEALAPRRGKDNTGITDRIVNQLLTFIDGVESSLGGGYLLQDEDSSDDSDGDISTPTSSKKKSIKKYQAQPQIYIMIASSRPDLIDPALLRPGRIEKHIYIGLPSSSTEIFDLLKKFLPVSIAKIDDCVNSALREVSRSSKVKSMSVADLKAVMDTAYLLAAHERIDSYPTLEYEEYQQNTEAQHSQPTTTTNTSTNYLQPVVLQGDHILKAFQDTRPSISSEDMQYYENAYVNFRKPSSSTSQTTDEQSPNGNSANGGILRTPTKNSPIPSTTPTSHEETQANNLQTYEEALQQRYDRIQNQQQVFH